MEHSTFLFEEAKGGHISLNKYFFQKVKIGDAALVKEILSTGTVNINASCIGPRIGNNSYGLPSKKKIEQRGWEAIHWAAKLGHVDLMDILHMSGANLESQTSDGNTPLMIASAFGHEAAVTYLLAKGCLIDYQDKHGWTALILAAFYGKKRILKRLIDQGASLNFRTGKGITALHMVLAHRKHDCLSLLTEASAALDLQDVFGNTPLHRAVRWNSAAAVQHLLEKGASSAIQDRLGRTPYSIALIDGKYKILKLLKAGNSNPNLANPTTVVSEQKEPCHQIYSKSCQQQISTKRCRLSQQTTGEAGLHLPHFRENPPNPTLASPLYLPCPKMNVTGQPHSTAHQKIYSLDQFNQSIQNLHDQTEDTLNMLIEMGFSEAIAKKAAGINATTEERIQWALENSSFSEFLNNASRTKLTRLSKTEVKHSLEGQKYATTDPTGTPELVEKQGQTRKLPAEEGKHSGDIFVESPKSTVFIPQPKIGQRAAGQQQHSVLGRFGQGKPTTLLDDTEVVFSTIVSMGFSEAVARKVTAINGTMEERIQLALKNSHMPDLLDGTSEKKSVNPLDNLLEAAKCGPQLQHCLDDLGVIELDDFDLLRAEHWQKLETLLKPIQLLRFQKALDAAKKTFGKETRAVQDSLIGQKQATEHQTDEPA